MGGAEEPRLEDLRSETQKFGEGEGSGRIPPGCHPRVLQRSGTRAARAGTGVNPNGAGPEREHCCHPPLALGNVARQVQ